MSLVRFGVVGVGGMGAAHCQALLQGKVDRGQLTAVADTESGALEKFAALETFATGQEMVRAGVVDAVIIAVPHYFHPPIAIDALGQGLHVLVEKPIAVHKADAERMLAAEHDPALVFAAMFNQRTDPVYRKIHQLIQDGTLGSLRRVNWIITSWFRPEAYYASGGWRATWKGEGGGVLLNQCPHQLDLYQWLFGMPQRVRGYCSLGRYHDIEVEDDVTAYFEHADGRTGVFITSTGEAPGTNRLEVVGENGKLVYEHNKIVFTRNEIGMSEFSRTTSERFAVPPSTVEEFTFDDHGSQHLGILQNFVDAILDGAPLLAPAVEGIHSVELANAILYSSLQDHAVELPMDSAAYERCLQDLIAGSTFEKKTTPPPETDSLAASIPS